MKGKLLLIIVLLSLAFSSEGQKTYRSLKKASEEPEKVFELKLVQSRPKEKAWKLFSKLENLNKLYLEDLLLDTLPVSMSGLTRMTSFRSHRNPIRYFPDSLKNWKALTYLELVESKLDTFPKICSYWGNLREIGIDRNRASQMVLPKAIGSLQDLRLLAINKSPLAKIPKSISKLSQLQKLILRNCKIDTLPPGLGRMKKLKTLVLAGNKIRELPRSIGSLKKLELLSLKGNLLEELPRTISGLSSLEQLDIRDNYFSAYQLDVIKATFPEAEILHDPVERKKGRE